MAFGYNTAYRSSEPLSTEKQKTTKEYFKDQGNYFISLLLRDNSHILTSRNYYSSKRDLRDFAYLEDVYGMQNPIDLGFTNIIKPRVDALVGMSILSDPDFTIAYVDKDTITSAEDERMGKFLEDLKTHTNQYMANARKKQEAAPGAPGEDGGKDPAVSNFLTSLSDKYGEDYESTYSVAANNALGILVNDPESELIHIKKQVSKDYFITGECYSRNKYRGDGKKPIMERIPPEQIFTNRPTIDSDLTNTDAVVRIRLMRPHQIIKEFGDKITKEQAVNIFGDAAPGSSLDLPIGAPDVNVMDESGSQMDEFYEDELKTGWSNNAYGPSYAVYHIEWLASTKIPDGEGGHVYREDRYEVFRIGMDEYIGGRRCDEAPRRKDEPWKTTLSYGGLVNNAGNGRIVSLVLQMKELQDLYDIIMFFRNNAIATSGVSGSRVNVAAIPKALGKKFMDRLTKWITIRKQGLELVDPTEEGAEMFQHYGDFNAAIRGDTMQGINSVLESLTAQADIISGVPRQTLGIIEERDAVENVRAGMNQVSVLSLEMFRDVDRMLASTLQGTLDDLKYAYRDVPLEGVNRIGMAYIPFSLDSDTFSTVDHEIRVISAGIESVKLFKIQSLAKEFLGAGVVDPDVILKIINSKSIAKAEYILKKGIEKKKEEMANMSQLEQQLEEASNELKKLQAEIDRLNNNSTELEKDKLEATKARDSAMAGNEKRRLDIEESRVANEKKFKDDDILLKRATVDLEKEQLMYGSGRSQEVNNELQ